MENTMSNRERETFSYNGINITLHFSDVGRTLQECMVDVLRIHME